MGNPEPAHPPPAGAITSADNTGALPAARPEDPQHQIAELTQAVSARDAFIAVAGHELRNPMTPIRAQIDLLLRQVRSGRASPQRLEAGLERAAWLVDQYVRRATTLLDVSRLTSGRLKLEPEPVDLALLVREVANSLAPLASHAGSPIGIEVPDAIAGTWDRLGLEQIVENLVSNAIKYGAGNPIGIEAELAGEEVRLRVRDRGTGITELDQARIFERFERAVGPGEHRGGFGVGLWIVRQLAQSMGGEIAVDSKAGMGTTFSVTLPLHTKASHD